MNKMIILVPFLIANVVGFYVLFVGGGGGETMVVVKRI